MAAFFSRFTTAFNINVKTGDSLRAGTDAYVWIRLYDDASHFTEPIVLDNWNRNDFEINANDTFKVQRHAVPMFEKSARIVRIELWKDDSGFNSDWQVDCIKVENCHTKEVFAFPLFRWIRSAYHYNINLLDTSLPQVEEYPEQRKKGLNDKRKRYQYAVKIENGPVQIRDVPDDERFSFSYTWDLGGLGAQLIVNQGVKKAVNPGEFQSIEDYLKLYDKTFPKPRNVDGWKDDVYFGYQRIATHHPVLIRAVTEIPEKFPVTDALLGDLLEGITLDDAIAEKRLFSCDYQLLQDLPTKDGFVICKPIGLFFVNKEGELVPVAIQLFQEPGTANPIFTPLDAPMLWRLVKMWFNNADAAYHESISHLGFTHLMMEGVSIVTQRTLSQSHPIFKLLTPHFLYLISINSLALTALVPPGQFIDNNMNAGSEGSIELMTRGIKNWRMDVQGTLHADLKDRGLDDPSVIPNYHYREDASDIYNAIKKYVTSYVSLYYGSTDDKLTADHEIQRFAFELVAERGKEGAGLKGVPGDGKLTSTDQLVQILTSVIFTSSVFHAAVNFPQYDQYCYPPNYSALMKGTPPTSKDVEITEEDLLKSLASRGRTLDTMVITKVLSTKGTQSLGNFEDQYIYEPEARKLVEEFQKDLHEISDKVKARNAKRKYQYDYLDPVFIPNAISI